MRTREFETPGKPTQVIISSPGWGVGEPRVLSLNIVSCAIECLNHVTFPFSNTYFKYLPRTQRPLLSKERR